MGVAVKAAASTGASGLERPRARSAAANEVQRRSAATADDGAGLWRRGTLPAEVVLQADHIVDLRRRHLHQLDALDRLVAVDPPRRNVGAVAGTELAGDDGPGVVLEVEPEATGQHVDGFILALVALKRQSLAALDDQDLAAVAVRQRPDELVAPGLWNRP